MTRFNLTLLSPKEKTPAMRKGRDSFSEHKIWATMRNAYIGFPATQLLGDIFFCHINGMTED